MWLKGVVGVSAVMILAMGGFAAYGEYRESVLARVFEESFARGDYLAALVAARDLRAARANGDDADGVLHEKITEAARMLVAEDAFRRAQEAARAERFVDAGALLRESGALDPSFRSVTEAKALYAEVEARAAAAAHQRAVTISELERRAQAEHRARTQAEQKATDLSGTLKEKDAALSDTTRRLSDSEARAAEFAERAAREARDKFFAEFRAYRDLAARGKGEIETAIAETNARRDVTALVSISQSRMFLEEAEKKIHDLRSRAHAEHRLVVDELVRAVAGLLDAGKQVRNAVVYMDDGGNNFTAALEGGKNILASASALLASVSSFIAANEGR